jgi:hypothetical protein
MPLSPRFVPLNAGPASSGVPARPRASGHGLLGLLDPYYGGDESVPGPASNNDPEGVSGNAPGTLGAAISGAQNGGLIGQTLGDLGVPSGLQGLGARGLTTLGGLTGVPALAIKLPNALIGAGRRAAEHNMRQAGRRVAPFTLGGPRTIPDTPPPNASFNDPANLGDIGGTPATPGTGSIAATPSFTTSFDLSLAPPAANPNMELVDLPDVDSFTAQVDAAIAAAAAQAQTDAISAAVAAAGDAGTGPAGDTSDGSGVGAYYHGGPVHGPGGIDNVPGWLTDQEFVVDRDSAQKFPDLVRALNQWEPGDDPAQFRGLRRLLDRRRADR